MHKQLTRTDYLIATLSIFFLVCAIGSFFIGFQIGKERTNNQWEMTTAQEARAYEQFGSYDQQQLAVFYHSIYVPYKTFQTSWFQTQETIEENHQRSQSIVSIRNLAKLADEMSVQIKQKTMPESSLLLKQASNGYQDSLQSFSKGLEPYIAKAKTMSSTELIQAMEADAKLQDAKKSALSAQKDYYNSIVKWQQRDNDAVQLLDSSKKISFDQWKETPVNIKNEYVSALMLQEGSFSEYLPHDVTARIDELLAKGEMQNLGVANIPAAVQLLNGTSAVRTDHFSKQRMNYAMEQLPNLPFFQ